MQSIESKTYWVAVSSLLEALYFGSIVRGKTSPTVNTLERLCVGFDRTPTNYSDSRPLMRSFLIEWLCRSSISESSHLTMETIPLSLFARDVIVILSGNIRRTVKTVDRSWIGAHIIMPFCSLITDKSLSDIIKF